MFKVIKGIRVNYTQYGEGQDVVLLHGWGQNIKMMDPLGKRVSEGRRITIIDLPGFGLSNEPETAYSVYDYTDFLVEFFKELNIVKPILIGHSFGGRLSIIYASKYDTEKIVLLGSPCVRHEYKSFKQSLLKFLKKLKIFNPLVNLMKKHTGSADYRNASPKMREILVKTVNEDLSECAKNIKCKALLIWGESDTAVPVEQAKELDELINDSKLVILSGTHYLYLEKIGEVSKLINEFLKEEV